MCSPARNAPDHELDDDCLMDEDELLHYADQKSLPFPTPTEVLGPTEQFLSDMPDFTALKKVCRGRLMHF
jgi:hypothetical protein